MIESKLPTRKETIAGLWDIAKLIITAIAIVVPFRYFIAQPFVVRGSSMEPNFEDRQYLVIDELTYRLRVPKRGEVIVFRYPKDKTEFFIKRIIGLPGDTVEIKEGKVRIKNKSLTRDFILDQAYLDPPNRPTYPDIAYTLGDDEYFVMGDNRDFSSDSRVWGTLKKELITGRAVFRVLPLSKLGLVPDFSVKY